MKNKQRVVLQVNMPNECARQKAMQIAAGSTGVMSVAIEGVDREQMTLLGEDVDVITLVTKLRKKVGYTRIKSVAQMKS